MISTPSTIPPPSLLRYNIFGYGKKNELRGKNVNVLIPPPFSEQHNGFVSRAVGRVSGETFPAPLDQPSSPSSLVPHAFIPAIITDHQ